MQDQGVSSKHRLETVIPEMFQIPGLAQKTYKVTKYLTAQPLSSDRISELLHGH